MTDDFGLKFVDPDRSKVVVLDLCDEVPEPDYCVLAKTKCLMCDRWCWLGSGTLEVVSDGAASPACQKCAAGVVAPQGYIGNVQNERHQHP